MSGAAALDVHIETPRTWLQFNDHFDVGFRGTQLAWLNCEVCLFALYHADTKSVCSVLTSQKILDGLTKAIARTDPRSNTRRNAQEKKASAIKSTKASIEKVIAVIEDYKKMPPPEPSTLHPEKITFFVFGKTNAGKTTFVNALTGLDLGTSIKGRTTTQLAPQVGKWFHADGRVWEFEIIDTPGVDDSEEQDKATFDQLQEEITNRGNVHAVLMVCNGGAPVMELSHVKAIKKFRDHIFGDCMLKNWGLVFSKWPTNPASVDENAEEVIESAREVFEKLDLNGRGTPLGNTPAKFFFQDSLPDRNVADPGGVRELFSCIDNLFDWMSTIEPIQTKEFLSLEPSKRKHIVNYQKLKPWLNEEFNASATDDGTTVKLSRSSMRVGLTVVMKILTFGNAATYYATSTLGTVTQGYAKQLSIWALRQQKPLSRVSLNGSASLVIATLSRSSPKKIQK